MSGGLSREDYWRELCLTCRFLLVEGYAALSRVPAQNYCIRVSVVQDEHPVGSIEIPVIVRYHDDALAGRAQLGSSSR